MPIRPSRLIRLVVLAVAVALIDTSAAATRGLAAQSTPAPDTAALVVQNRAITVFRAPLGALSPRERADEAAKRIQTLIDQDGSDSIDTRSIPEGALVTVAGRAVFSITSADVDTLAGERLADVTTRSMARLRAALAAGREQRSVSHLLWAIGLALAATLIVIVVVRLLVWGRRRLRDRILVAAATRLPDIRIRGFTLFSAESALTLVRRLVDITAWGAGLVAVYLWLAFVLTRFAYSRPWGEALGGYLRATVGALVLSAIGAVPGLFTVVLILVVTRWLTRLVAAFFDAVESGGVEVPWPHPETATATKRIVIALLWMFAVVVAYPYVPGSGSVVFKGVSVFAGVMLSLGSSGIVNQAMSGLVLMYSRALKLGDYVRIGETEGTVTALGMLSTKVRSIKREEVTLPNAVVVGASVKNYSRTPPDPGLLVYTSVTIGYDTPWRQVEALLRLAAERTAGLRREPAPFILKTSLSDFYIEYQLNAVIARPEERLPVLDQLHAHILDAFNEYGVQIMSPHYRGDPGRRVVVPRDQWFAPPSGNGAPRPPAGDDPARTRPGSDSEPIYPRIT